MVPAARLLLLLVLTAPLFLVGAPVAVAALVALAGAAVADALRTPRPRGVRVARRLATRMALGAEGVVALEVEADGSRPVHLLLTDDLPPALRRLGPEVIAVEVEAGRGGRAEYRVRAEERGRAVLGDVHLRALGPLGLVWRQWRVPRTDGILVQPGVREVSRHRMLAQRHRLREAGVRTIRERGEGSSFESLRDYVAGDDPRRIDWKATARRSTATVRQYEAERSQNVMIVVDAGRMMTERIGARERLDHALSAALLLADVALQQGDRVGVMVFAERVQQFVPPARVPLSRVAGALAEADGRLVEPDYPGAFGYLARSLRRRSLLVLFTDVVDARASAALLAHLRAAGRRHLPLVVTLRNTALEEAAGATVEGEEDAFRRAAAEELLQARAQALLAMQRAGMLVADTRPDDAAPAVINRYLEVKGRGLL